MGYNSDEASKKIKIAVKQMNGTLHDRTDEDGNEIELLPEIAIGKGTGYIHCYAPGKKRFIKVSQGQKGIVIDEMKENEEKCLVYTWDGFLVEIPIKEIYETGFD